MPVRQFGANADVNCAIGAAGPTAAWSFAGIVYATGPSAEYFQSYAKIPANPSTTELYYAVGRENGRLTLYRVVDSNQPGELPKNEWLFVAATKASGTVQPKLYYYRFSNETWTIVTGALSIANASAGAEKLVFGQWGDGEQFLGKMAAAAIYDKALTEAEVKALVAVAGLEEWLGTGPKGLWLFNQKETSEKVLDLTGGGADEQTSANTSVVEEEPPIPYVPEEGEGGSKVKVLVGGSIVEANRWTLINGELVAV